MTAPLPDRLRSAAEDRPEVAALLREAADALDRLRALTEDDPTSIYHENSKLREQRNILAEVRNDAMWMARLARGCSWPGDMAQQVEQGADRVLRLLSEDGEA